MESNTAENDAHLHGGQHNGGRLAPQHHHEGGRKGGGPKFLQKVPSGPKSHFTAAISEFIGTFLFLLFAFGGTNAVNTAPNEGQPEDLAANPARLLFISLCFGMSLAVNAWVFFRISGGLFNPAVTIGLMVIGAVGFLRGVIVIISQFLGGIAAAALISGLQPGGLFVSTTLSAHTSTAQGFFIELFLTAELVFTIMMLAVEKHRSTFLAPLGIGLALFIAEMTGVYYTGGSLNPARSFGPAVVTRSFPSYHWIYFLGPILGAILAAGFYKLIKILEYESVNPGQDDDGIVDPRAPFANAEGPLKSDLNPARHHHSAPNATTGAYGEGPSLESGRT